MKKPALALIGSLVAFTVGLIAVRILHVVDSREPSAGQTQVTTLQADQPLAAVDIRAVEGEEIEESTNPLDKAWVEADRAEYRGVSVTRECKPDELDWVKCKLTVRENGITRRTFEIEQPNTWWLRFGFFDFLGNGNKQLIVHTYSGGAHCCFDYVIFDIGSRLRVIYDSSKYDSVNEIGYELVPVDIDSDGIYEFHQRIEAFSYFHASYAGSNKPTAVFAYNRKRGSYELANKRFSDYVLADTQRALGWVSENPAEGDDVFLARETFLNYIYSGNKEMAWEFFEKNYKFEDKAQYRRDVTKLFKTEPVYLSIYRNGQK